jgi:hypothetical protein
VKGILEYHKSISNEFKNIENRVRNLIIHWPEDGRYKEVVLRNIFRKFLPQDIQMGTGFVVRPDKQRGKHLQSKQIDIILFSTSYPVLFQEGDFVILSPECVKGIIEVKTDLSNLDFDKVIETCNLNAEFIFKGKKNVGRPLFNGLFCFNGKIKENYMKVLRERYDMFYQNDRTKYFINHIAINENLFIKCWHPGHPSPNPFSSYEIEDLSFSYFISNALEMVTENGFGNDEYLWYPNDKEIGKICDF